MFPYASRIGLWAVGGVAAVVLIAAWSYPGAEPPAPAPAATATPRPANRIVIPQADTSQPAIETVLAVPGRLRYGQSVWDERGVPAGPLWVRIDRDAQLISVFRGPHEIATAVILYGAPEKPTPPGRYPILERQRTHRSTLYDADMPYMLRLTGDGISIHASDVREGRATHGCIGLPPDFARRLFEEARVGDAVVIV